ADRRIGEAELGLPDRKQHVDEVGVAVVQRMRAAGDAERAALLLRFGKDRGWVGDDGHPKTLAHVFVRRSANFAPTNENTSSPCWLVPVLSATISPQPGWRVASRSSFTSRAKLIVSPA